MLDKIVKLIDGKVPGSSPKSLRGEMGDEFIKVNMDKIKEVAVILKGTEGYDFNVLQVISGCDYSEHIEVCYILASFIHGHELLLKVDVPKDAEGGTLAVDSLSHIWKSANFQERECYDMFGVVFEGHPDLRRILCPDDWVGFPLRKNYIPEESYRDMKINPIEKINTGEIAFAQQFKERAENPKIVAFSWDYDKFPIKKT